MNTMINLGSARGFTTGGKCFADSPGQKWPRSVGPNPVAQCGGDSPGGALGRGSFAPWCELAAQDIHAVALVFVPRSLTEEDASQGGVTCLEEAFRQCFAAPKSRHSAFS